eukprot:g1442.t1
METSISNVSSKEVSNEEAELYDRQIRLWGVEAQSRVRSAKVLIAGLQGLHTEVCKNLVLAGISVTIQDDKRVTKEDLGGAQFFLKPEDLGKNRALASKVRVQELNPFVEVKCVAEPLSEKDASFFESFDVVSILGGDMREQIRVSKICHSKDVKMYVSEACGFLSQIVADLNGHAYVKVGHGGKVLSKAPTKIASESFADVMKSQSWGKVHKALRWGIPFTALGMLVWKCFVSEFGSSADASKLRTFTERCLKSRGIADDNAIEKTAQIASRALAASDVDLTPVCAIVGGVLAQDIVKVVSKHNEPIDTIFTFDGITGEGRHRMGADDDVVEDAMHKMIRRVQVVMRRNVTKVILILITVGLLASILLRGLPFGSARKSSAALFLKTSHDDVFQARRRPAATCQRGEWSFASGYSITEENFGTWLPSNSCLYRNFRREEAESLFARYGRVLLVGDSIQRGLFWNLVGLLKGVSKNDAAGSNGRYEYRMVNFMHQVSFTNVQDQELVAIDRRNGAVAFSLRFVYAAHATDFPGRCDAVRKWFFQCPEPLDVVLNRLLKESQSESRSYALTYVNVGMWDWRTGVPVAQFAGNFAEALRRVDGLLLTQGGRRMWRHTTAAYPSKFAWPDECKQSKIRDDTRPCNIHTDGLFRYNRAVTRTLRANRFEIIDAWPVSATRPDMTLDGIHYGLGARVSAGAEPHNYTWAQSDYLFTPAYRALNNQFLTVLLDP